MNINKHMFVNLPYSPILPVGINKNYKMFIWRNLKKIILKFLPTPYISANWWRLTLLFYDFFWNYSCNISFSFFNTLCISFLIWIILSLSASLSSNFFFTASIFWIFARLCYLLLFSKIFWLSLIYKNFMSSFKILYF